MFPRKATRFHVISQKDEREREREFRIRLRELGIRSTSRDGTLSARLIRLVYRADKYSQSQFTRCNKHRTDNVTREILDSESKPFL